MAQRGKYQRRRTASLGELPETVYLITSGFQLLTDARGIGVLGAYIRQPATRRANRRLRDQPGSDSTRAVSPRSRSAPAIATRRLTSPGARSLATGERAIPWSRLSLRRRRRRIPRLDPQSGVSAAATFAVGVPDGQDSRSVTGLSRTPATVPSFRYVVVLTMLPSRHDTGVISARGAIAVARTSIVGVTPSSLRPARRQLVDGRDNRGVVRRSPNSAFRHEGAADE